MIRYRLISILIGAGLDSLIGDPQWMPHPVRLMGALISALEKLLRREEDSTAELRFKGLVVTIFVLSTTIRITWGLLIRLYGLHPAAGVAAESILCCYALAARNLRDSSMEVYEALTAADGSLSKARRAVSMIVGRDTENLDREGVIRAAVETVAENTADGVIAPLFYLALGGAVGGMAYKAINTMDSMLGYKNERYQYFGTVAARLDDAAGFIPARLSGLLLVAAAGLTGMDAANAWRIFCRRRALWRAPLEFNWRATRSTGGRLCTNPSSETRSGRSKRRTFAERTSLCTRRQGWDLDWRPFCLRGYTFCFEPLLAENPPIKGKVKGYQQGPGV